jgi:hypothetical protein
MWPVRPGAAVYDNSGQIGEKPLVRLGPRRWTRIDRQRVDIALQEVGERRVHQPVARHGRDAAERLRDDSYAKMALSPGGTGMSGVPVTFVFDGEFKRSEFGREAQAQPFFASRSAHGGAPSDCTGRILLFSHNTCGIMKSSIATLIPNTLKLTQTLSVKVRAT